MSTARRHNARIHLLVRHLTEATDTESPPLSLADLKAQIKAATTNTASSQGKYSAEEWAVRVDLAAAYQIAAKFGWDEVIYNHITMRVPGDDEHFLINPFGLHFSEMTASSLVTIDLDGNIVDPGDTELGYNRAGFVIHSALHELCREDIKCVWHTHHSAIAGRRGDGD